MKAAYSEMWQFLAVIVSTVVSKAVLDLNEETKKPKIDRGGLAMRVTLNAVRAIKDCGLLDPSRPIEVIGVQQIVWKDLFPQPFPHPNPASSTPPGNSNNPSSQSGQ